ncbi:MAG: nucleotidyltransferase [Desulfomonile tiedjei]|nr:nucleotidyltransferase [Desulfomonile tiedjei]
MGGGGGKSSGSRPSAGSQVEQQVRETEYTQELNQFLKEKLSEYNRRDSEAINRHVETLKQKLSAEIEDFVELKFGGSVSKHTYVNGFSDVDILVNVKGTELEDYSPNDLLSYFAERIKERLPDTDIHVGSMAVTVSYSDGTQIQLLPSLRTATGLRVPDPEGNNWSNVVRPLTFAKKLTEVNMNCGGQVVPVIKLFKAIQQSMPSNAQLTGYHIESLALNAFRDYSGTRSYQEMLKHLFEYAAENVSRPISDSTRQSLHVDDYLGAADSTERQRVAAFLGRMGKRLASADAKMDLTVWQGHFGDE